MRKGYGKDGNGTLRRMFGSSVGLWRGHILF